MSKLHIVFRFLINIVCLALSTSLIIHFLYNLSDDPIYRIAVFPAVIVIELLAQYVLSMGRFYLKKGKWIKGGLLVLCFVWYLFSFALFSALAYFNVEIAAQEQIIAKTAFTEDLNRQKWEQNQVLINSLNKQLETEAKTGYGSRSTEIMKQIAKLREEQKELSQKFEEGATEPEKLPVDMFGSLAAVFGFPVNLLKILVFGTLVLFVYLGMVLTNWDVDFSETEKTEVVSKPLTPVTSLSDYKKEVLQVKPNETLEEQRESFKVTSKPLTQKQDELIRFVEALFDTENTNRLNGVERIFNTSNLTFRRCQEYRDYLSSIGAIDVTPGNNKAIWSKEQILDYIRREVK